jgi:hypothetical protein
LSPVKARNHDTISGSSREDSRFKSSRQGG